MMKNIAVRVALVSLAFIVGIAAAALNVDLDKPGAMDALKRDRPAHFKKVSEEISKAQEIRLDPHPTLQRADIVTYLVTVHMTKQPAQLQKAK